VADWSAEMVPAVAVKFADVEFAGIVTEPGTVRAAALLESVTVAAAAAGWLKDTVQLEVPLLFNEVGLQERLLTPVWLVVMVPGAPVTVMAEPSAAAPMVLVTDMAALATPEARVTFTKATMPFDIRLAFRPDNTQL